MTSSLYRTPIDEEHPLFSTLQSQNLIGKVNAFEYPDDGKAPYVHVSAKRDEEGNVFPGVGEWRGATVVNCEYQPIVYWGLSAPTTWKIDPQLINEEYEQKIFSFLSSPTNEISPFYEGALIAVSRFKGSTRISTNSNPHGEKSFFRGSRKFGEMFYSLLGMDEEQLTKLLFGDFITGSRVYYFLLCPLELSLASKAKEDKVFYLGNRECILKSSFSEEKFGFFREEVCFEDRSFSVSSFMVPKFTYEQALSHLRKGHSSVESEFNQECLIVNSLEGGILKTFKIEPIGFTLRLKLVCEPTNQIDSLNVCRMRDLSHSNNIEKMQEILFPDSIGNGNPHITKEKILEIISDPSKMESGVPPFSGKKCDEWSTSRQFRDERFFFLCMVRAFCGNPKYLTRYLQLSVDLEEKLNSVCEMLDGHFDTIPHLEEFHPSQKAKNFILRALKGRFYTYITSSMSKTNGSMKRLAYIKGFFQNENGGDGTNLHRFIKHTSSILGIGGEECVSDE